VEVVAETQHVLAVPQSVALQASVKKLAPATALTVGPVVTAAGFAGQGVEMDGEHTSAPAAYDVRVPPVALASLHKVTAGCKALAYA
jgi:hypothetical protein